MLPPITIIPARKNLKILFKQDQFSAVCTAADSGFLFRTLYLATGFRLNPSNSPCDWPVVAGLPSACRYVRHAANT